MGRPGLLPAHRTTHAGLPGKPARPRRKTTQSPAPSIGIFGPRALGVRSGAWLWPRCEWRRHLMKRRRVTQSFSAQQSTSRARGNFAVGDLLILQESPETPDQSRFVRMNGLRPNLGRELHYLLEAAELREKTEAEYPGPPPAVVGRLKPAPPMPHCPSFAQRNPSVPARSLDGAINRYLPCSSSR